MARIKLIRRVTGAVCLGAAVVMLAAGETKPAEDGSPTGFALYWIACFLLAGLAMVAAIWDLGSVRREARAEQRALLETALQEIEAEKMRRTRGQENPAEDGLEH